MAKKKLTFLGFDIIPFNLIFPIKATLTPIKLERTVHQVNAFVSLIRSPFANYMHLLAEVMCTTCFIVLKRLHLDLEQRSGIVPDD